jgi:outer membrane protein TolC
MRGFAILLAAMTLCHAQTQSPPEMELTMRRAVEIATATDGNARVQLVNESIAQAQARSVQARSAILPTLDGTVGARSFTQNLQSFGLRLNLPELPGFNFAIPTLVGPVDVFDARATAQWNMLDFSAIKRYQASKAGIEAARAETGSVRDDVSQQVARAYLAVLRAEAARETALANVRLSEELVRLANSQKEAGTGTGIDVTRARVQLANDQQRSIVTANEVDRAKMQLLRVMGVPTSNRVRLVERLSRVPVDARDLEAALALARNDRPDIQTQLKREETARLNYSAAKWERLPTLGATTDYGSIGLVGGSVLPTYTVAGSVRIPVFDFGRRDADRKNALSQYRSEQIRTADLRKQAELEVRLALDALESADAQIRAAEEGLQLSENELAQAQRRFQAGVSTNIEVTDAQTRLQRARENRITALFNYNLARIDLAAATGKIQEMVKQ